MTSLVIVTGYNSPPRNPRDADCVFLPESLAFKALHAGESGTDCARLVIEHPQSAARRRAAVADAIRRTPGLDVLAVFGHGTASKLVATGHGMGQVQDLVLGIVNAIQTSDPHRAPLDVVLYACLTARGKMGFADQLADCLPWAHVWAHSTPGHTTWNPHVELSGGPNGGDPVFVPKDGPRWKRWRDRLRDEQAFRLSFWCPARWLARQDALEAVRSAATE